MTVDVVKGTRIIRVADCRDAFQAYVMRYFEVYFNAVIPHEENGMLVADFSKPAVHRYSKSGLDLKISSLPEEEDVLDVYTKHTPRSTHLAFDAGAYCGLSTYKLSHMFDRVVAFEPDAVNRECLLSNIERHELDNITVVANAMSATTGSARFWVDGSLGSRLALPEYTRGRFENIETTSLVDACIKYGIPELICMDIESAEIEVLDAARDLLKQQSIIFSIDTNHDEVHGWTFGRVEEILRSCGYQVETGMPGGFYTTWGWK